MDLILLSSIQTKSCQKLLFVCSLVKAPLAKRLYYVNILHSVFVIVTFVSYITKQKRTFVLLTYNIITNSQLLIQHLILKHSPNVILYSIIVKMHSVDSLYNETCKQLKN